MVPPCETAADIGTDHAAVPIELVRRGKCPQALACDILEGPLSAAREHIRAAGLADRIGAVLSDGFAALPEGCCDAAVICGMGGQTIRHILEGRGRIGAGLRSFVLSPQSEQEELRAYLRGEGLAICAEDLVLEDGKFYPVIRAEVFGRRVSGREGVSGNDGIPDEEAAQALSKDTLFLQRVLDRFGPCLIGQAHPLLPAYLERREKVLAQIESGLAKSEGPRAEEKRRELETERRMIAAARRLWENAAKTADGHDSH